MMRALTYLLILANAGFLLWQATNGAPKNATMPVPDPGIKKLLLLRETLPEHAGAQQSSARTTVSNGDEVCFTLGPFRSQDAVAQAREAMLDMKLDPTGRVRNEREQYGFQVYLPPYESREEAIKAARHLTEQGIAEYYIMNESELRNAISLGLFRNKSHASRQVERLKESGVFAEILPRYRDRKLYWLDYADEQQVLSKNAIRQLFPDHPVQRLERACG